MKMLAPVLWPLNASYSCPECHEELFVSISLSQGVAELNHGSMNDYHIKCSRQKHRIKFKLGPNDHTGIYEGERIPLLHISRGTLCEICGKLYVYQTILPDNIRIKFYHHSYTEPESDMIDPQRKALCWNTLVRPLAAYTIWL